MTSRTFILYAATAALSRHTSLFNDDHYNAPRLVGA
jgi:hypothetical protein